MPIQIDSREKKKQLEHIIPEFDRHGISHFVSKLYVGDYMSLDNPRTVIDRKHDLLEVAINFTESRFVEEMEKAKKAGIQIIFLIEHGHGIDSIDAVSKWQNPRLKTSPMALSGDRIARKMIAYEHTYGVKFCFCDRSGTGEAIIFLLGA